MNSDDFLVEVLDSDICPPDFKKIYQEFQTFQHAALETLKEFHNVCERNNIPYQVTFGSLLGIVRHDGLIPWDYDIDVFVPYTEKNKLIDALKQQMNSNFYFYCPELNQHCRHVITRVSPNGFRSEALHVDVFYYIKTATDEISIRQHMAQIKYWSRARYIKLLNPREEATGDIKKIIGFYKSKIRYLFTSVETIDNNYKKLCDLYTDSNSNEYIEADSFADSYLIPSSYLDRTVLRNTSMGLFRIPEQYDELLTLFYNDYYVIPSLERRIHEVIYNYNRIKFYNHLK